MYVVLGLERNVGLENGKIILFKNGSDSGSLEQFFYVKGPMCSPGCVLTFVTVPGQNSKGKANIYVRISRVVCCPRTPHRLVHNKH